MKIAIVHEWVTVIAGSDICFKIFSEIYPNADLFVLVSDKKSLENLNIDPKRIKNSLIQKLPKARKKWKTYLLLFPFAVEQFDLSEYDVVISSSHAVAKGVLTTANQIHICYIYSPIRYVWDLCHQYLNEANLRKGIKSLFVRFILHYIRNWDVGTANRVDEFVPISNYIEKRVWRTYRRKSYKVIYPPVSTNEFTLVEKKEDFYLTASRLVPYKKINLIVQAFSQMPEKQLVVIGDGPNFKKINKLATKNVKMLGYQEFGVLKSYMQRSKAFIFIALEDFGIIPVEAQACGTPVIALGKGGSLETVKGKFVDEEIKASDTGIFLKEQSVDELLKAIRYFEKNAHQFSAKNIRKFAMKFDESIFKQKIRDTFDEIIEKYKN